MFCEYCQLFSFESSYYLLNLVRNLYFLLGIPAVPLLRNDPPVIFKTKACGQDVFEVPHKLCRNCASINQIWLDSP